MAESNSEPAVSTEEMLNYLSLDETPENKTVVDALVEEAEDTIQAAIGENLSASVLNSDKTYVSAVKALASFTFYDRTMSQGIPQGIQSRITILQGRYDSWPDDSNNGKG